MLYSPLRQTGWYWALLLQIEYASTEGCGRRHVAIKGRSRATQFVTAREYAAIRAIYFHCVSFASMCSAEKMMWIKMETERPRDMEIPADEADDALVARSYAKSMEWLAANPTAHLQDD